MKKVLPTIAALAIGLVAFLSIATAGVPTMLSYQGILLDGNGDPVTTQKNVAFTIWDAETIGNVEWSDTLLVTPDENGFFSVLLGEDELNPLTDDVFDEPGRWIGISIEGEAELSPRSRVTSVGYAQRVSTIDEAKAGTVKGAMIVAPTDTSSEDAGLTVHNSLGEKVLSIGEKGIMMFGATDADTVFKVEASDTNAGVIQATGLYLTGGSPDTSSPGLTTDYPDCPTSWGFPPGPDIGDNAFGYHNDLWYARNSFAVGSCNKIGSTYPYTWNSTALGGYNTLYGGWSFASGFSNTAYGNEAVALGSWNTIISPVTIVIGTQNTVNGWGSFVGGVGHAVYASMVSCFGWDNHVSGNSMYVSCFGAHNYITDGQGSSIASGTNNTINGGWFSAIGSGDLNVISGDGSYNAILTGTSDSLIHTNKCAILSGSNNRITTAMQSVITSGAYNVIETTSTCVLVQNSAIGGGSENSIKHNYATIAGGHLNQITAPYAAIGGGEENIGSGNYCTIPGGFHNRAAGNLSLAAGYRGKADHHGTFVWADATDEDFTSTGQNQFLIRAGGGVGIGTNAPQGALDVSSTTGGFIVPRMTTTERDALIAVNGMIIYNLTDNQFYFYENGAWVTK